MTKKYNDFTLLELLIVFAIIMIMASMLLPAFSKVNEVGRRTSCQNSLRQIAYITILYSNDHNGLLATTNDTDIGVGSILMSLGYFNPKYTGTKAEWYASIFWKGCPSKGEGNVLSYGWNDYIYRKAPGITISKVTKPSLTCGFIDCRFDPFWSLTQYEVQTLKQGRHNKLGLNFSFIDGHVKWYKAYSWKFESSSLWVPNL